MCVSLMAALLGNHVLTESDLSAFHARLIPKLENKVTIPNRLLIGLHFFKIFISFNSMGTSAVQSNIFRQEWTLT
jgi:hypothetical protein